MYNDIKDYPVLLNVDHVTNILGVSTSKVYEIMRENGFPLIKIGSNNRVLKEDFINWLKEKVAAQGG